MRPQPHEDADARYECTECGGRETDAERQRLTCPECGGALKNIGVSRDV